MIQSGHRTTILVAEDDEDDRLMIRRAWRKRRRGHDLRFVADGEELMDYLHRRGEYAAPSSAPRPRLILLDLNMPRKDGREALAEIKSSLTLRAIPVVVLTTSDAEEDIRHCCDLGANSYIRKPTEFVRLVKIIAILDEYWNEIVESLPE
ncbi:MAG: response regulator [Acidobacteriota bacterium]